jgi:undecaprenyl pyrophosphate phosphatase UppP
MPLCQAVVLASIQGLAEFLPVSTTAHLILWRKIERLPAVSPAGNH